VWCQEVFKKRNLFGAKAPAHSEKRKKNRPTLVQTLPPERLMNNHNCHQN